MQYLGIQTQIRRNNLRSLLLLVLFPLILILLTWLFSLAMSFAYTSDVDSPSWNTIFANANLNLIQILPFVLAGCALWFLIAYLIHSKIITKATHATGLSRKENMRVYNLLENLCISQGMQMPKLQVIQDTSLNAFASGIDEQSYTITLTQGIIDTLNDQELEGVIAHELSHIRNRDVRLLIISIIFVGIFATIARISFNMIIHSQRSGSYRQAGNRRKKDNEGGAILLFLVLAILGIMGKFFSDILRLALSRKREFLADASAVEMTRNPLALASALRKISNNYQITSFNREDIAQLFIQNKPKKTRSFSLASLFATHPPIEQRITILEQF